MVGVLYRGIVDRNPDSFIDVRQEAGEPGGDQKAESDEKQRPSLHAQAFSLTMHLEYIVNAPQSMVCLQLASHSNYEDRSLTGL
jgi:hypothetical protein